MHACEAIAAAWLQMLTEFFGFSHMVPDMVVTGGMSHAWHAAVPICHAGRVQAAPALRRCELALRTRAVDDG
jgi:hypothetical protein